MPPSRAAALLTRWQLEHAEIEMVDRHQCGPRCQHVPALPLGDMQWDRCPRRHMYGVWWRQVDAIDAAARISPLAGWPMSWSAGIVSAIGARRAEADRWQAEQARAAADRARVR